MCAAAGVGTLERMRLEVTAEFADGTLGDVAVCADPHTPSRAVNLALARVMQTPPPVHVDGVMLDDSRPWTGLLRTGSVLRAAPGPRAAGTAARLIVAAGIDAGRSFDLAARAAHIGRGDANDVGLSDPEVSRFHAVLTNDGRSFAITDDASTNGTWIDGARVEGTTAFGPGQLLRVGNTVLRLESAATDVAAPAQPPVLTRPAAAPLRPRTPIPVAACVASAGAALAVGSLAHSVQFMLLSLVSPLVLLPAALGGRLRDARLERRARTAHRAELDTFHAGVAAALRDEAVRRRRKYPDPAALVDLVASGIRPVDRDGAWGVRIGLADQPAELSVRADGGMSCAGTARLVPVVVDLRPGVLRLTGSAPEARRLARWLVVQSSTRFSDRELEIRFVLDHAHDADWLWARWLPQVAAVEPARSIAPDARAAGPPHRLVVLDHAGADLPDAALADAYGPAVVLVVGGAASPGSRVMTVQAGSVELVTDDGARLVGVADGIDVESAERCSRGLAREASRTRGRRTVGAGLIGLVAADADSLRLRWRTAGCTARSVIGSGGPEPFEVDLCTDGPHAVVVGTTGAGKSELLRTWIAGLALNYPPDQLSFVLIDYKGGAAFGSCAALPHVASVVTDLDRAGAARALRSLHAELRRRETIFARAGVTSLEEYRSCVPTPEVARLVLMIDEFAALAQEQSEFVDGLLSVAQRGRSLGVHLVLATQRAGSAITADIRANTSLRLVLRVAEASESVDLLGVADAAHLSPDRKGAAYARTADGLHLVQVAHVSAPEAAPGAVTVTRLGPWRVDETPPPLSLRTELDAVVDVVQRVAAADAHIAPGPPWSPPLPDVLALADLPPSPGVAFGTVDLPDEQRREPAVLDLDAGTALLFTGPPRSGRTTALITLATAATRALSPMDLVVYVMDAAGGALATRLADLPHVATSTTSDSSDQVATLVARLREEVRRRRAGDAASPGRGPCPRVLVLVDGRAELTRLLDAADNGRSTTALAQLIADGPSVGVSFAVATVTDDGLRAGQVFSETYALGSEETRPSLRRPPTGSTATTAGRCVRASDGAAVQLALAPGPGAAVHPGHEAVTTDRITIRPLPAQVPLDSLLPAEREFVLGVGGDDARPVALDLVSTRSQLLVAGPPSSGKSVALVSFLLQCLRSRLRVCVAAHDRSPLAAAARAHGIAVLAPWETWPAIDCADGMLLVDDIERFVDQAAGDALTAAICAPNRSYAVVAAGDATDLSVLHRAAIAQLRRGRVGLLLQPRPVDGELLGIRLARSTPTPHPGRGVLVAGPDELGRPGGAAPISVQVALPSAAQPMCG